MNKSLKRIMAVLLLICMMGMNLSTIGIYGITYALSEDEISKQNAKTQDSNVEFNAYFEGGAHVKTEKMNSDVKLYLNIKLNGAGYLEKGVVSFQDTNFEIDKSISNDNIQSVDVKNNKILLNKINGGSNVVIEVPVNVLNTDEVSIDNFSKETKTVFTATYINKDAKEKNVSKEIINKLSWDGTTGTTITPEIKTELTKYIPYTSDENSGVVLQVKVNSGIKDSILPIKATELNIQVPEINGIKPTSVNVIANQTKATNGMKDGLNFNADNYNYDAENSKLVISTQNLSNKISWLKNVSDEYFVTFVFENKDVYDYAIANGIDTNLKISGNIKVHSNQEKNIEFKETTTDIKESKEKGQLIDYAIKTNYSSIAKGQMYASFDAKNKKETTYKVDYYATISAKELTGEIKLQQGIDQFVTADDSKNSTTVSGKNYTYNKTISINKNVFEKILGTDGKIEVYDNQKTKLGTINKTTELKDENYTLDISNVNNNQLLITTSKPIIEGQLIISVEKAIKNEIGYNKKQLQNFTKLTTQVNNELKEISLTEPTTAIYLEVNKQDLTTVVENENVEIRAVLDTSNTNYVLYKNPTLKIKFPSYIAKFKLNSYDILMSNGLKIKNAKTVLENGQVVVYVELEGTQTEYTIDAQYKGTIIIINANITAKTLTPNNKNKITMNYTNENDVATEKSGKVETNLNFIAPEGLITANGIKNYSQGENELLSISSEGATGILKTYAEKRTAKVYGKIVNNYENDIKDVIILGRIPTQGNKKIETGEDLGSTFSTKLQGKITLSGVDSSKYKVYYSENANATKDLNDKSNNWTETLTNKVQSYMIVLNENMKSGETKEISYDVEIPANITHNNTVNEMYKVYYTNVSSLGEISESKTSPLLKLTTGVGPDMTVEVKSTTETVREEQIVRMTATVKNVGTVEAKNVKLNLIAPEGTVHTEIFEEELAYTDSEENIKTLSIGNIPVGQTVTRDYELRIKKGKTTKTVTDPTTGQTITIEENKYPGDKEIECTANVTADELSNPINSDSYKLKVLEGDLKIVNIPDIYESETLKKGRKFKFVVKVKNISNSKDLNNVMFNMDIPQGIKITDVYYGENNNFKEKSRENVIINNNSISINLGKLENLYAYIERTKPTDESETNKATVIKLREYTYVGIELEVEGFTGEFIAKATAKADETAEHYSNQKIYNAEEIKLTIQQKEADSRYIKEGKEVTYKYIIENTGKISSINNKFIMSLPDGVTFVKAEYTNNNKKQTIKTISNKELNILMYEIIAGAKVTITVTVKADLLPDKNDKIVSSYATLEADGFDKIESNKVNITIEYDANAHAGENNGGNNGGNNNNPNNPTTESYKITGTAWLDSNKNGMRDEDEKLLSNIQVMLVYKKTNAIVKDSVTNNDKKVTTDNNGKYEFDNIKPGEYLVIFVYDSGKYSITEYRKPEVDEALNSDAIDINIVLNGERTIAGISDVIKVTNSNIRDIDIGLYEAEKFDLKLDKYISKITRTTPTSGTETFTYANEKNTKIEVLKQNLGKSSIVIEYKIVVTNQGGVAGFVKKIADYLPKGVIFNTELNKDWYKASDGNVYNTSLQNTIIQPGESKEVTIVLLKQITDDSLGILNNNAEIYESYNEQGLKDIDSTPGNKQEDEDDMSKADIILSVVTGGQIAFYVIITLTFVAIIGLGVVEIKKRVLNRKQ